METFLDFYNKFIEIKSEGFIQTLRNGSGGSGHTLEQKLGLKENNLSLPDLIKINAEMKTKRITSKSSLLTLYTNETGWQISEIDFIEKYGWNHRKHHGEKTAQSTITSKINKRGFYLDTTDSKYLSAYKNDLEFIKWDWNNIANNYIRKFENLIIVDVDVIKKQNIESFHYIGFNLYRGTSANKFRECIKQGLVSVDLRLYTQYNLNKGVRNRGTAFRIKHKNVTNLYDTREYYS